MFYVGFKRNIYILPERIVFMKYNFIKKITQGEFSFKEDFDQTVRDIYTFTGLDKLIQWSDQLFVRLNEGDRRLVEREYNLGTISTIVSISNLSPSYITPPLMEWGIDYQHQMNK